MTRHTRRTIWALGLLLGASLLSFTGLGVKARARSVALAERLNWRHSAAAAPAPVAPALSATITVNDAGTTIANDGKCTLPEAIINANNDNQSGSTDCAAGSGADTINIDLPPGAVISFAAAHNFEYGPNALPPITSEITIQGNGAVLDSTATVRLRFFYVSGGLSGGLPLGKLTLRDLTLRNGKAKGGDAKQGGGGGSYGSGGFGGFGGERSEGRQCAGL